MENQQMQLKKYYSLLKGMDDTISVHGDKIPGKVIKIYNNLIKKIYEITNDEIILDFQVSNSEIYEFDLSCSPDTFCYAEDFYANIKPVLSFLDDIYKEEESLSKIGSLYSSIENPELRERCLDILYSKGPFDRVINQATLVLEDSIRKKAQLEKENLSGVPLVLKAIAPKIENTILQFSDKKDIHESYAFLFKSMIGVYRNPTHHTTTYVCTREDALKCCAFVDYLLKELNSCKFLNEVKP